MYQSALSFISLVINQFLVVSLSVLIRKSVFIQAFPTLSSPSVRFSVFIPNVCL